LILGDAPSEEVFRNLVALVVPTNFIGVLLLAAQVEHAMTKTKTSELAIAELVRKLTATQMGNESPPKAKV
jgi:hypothetical protein